MPHDVKKEGKKRLTKKPEEDRSSRDRELYTSPNDAGDYRFVKDSYDGTGGYKTGTYLVPHNREMNYIDRMALAFYKNYIKPISDARIDPVFGDIIPRNIKNKTGDEKEGTTFEEFLKNIDNGGRNIQQFMFNASQEAGLQGLVFIIMDNFPADEQPDNLEAVIAERKFPYVFTQTKNTLTDFELDRHGNIIWILFEEDPVEVEKQGRKEKERRFRRWDNMVSQVLKIDPKSRRDDIKYIAAGPIIEHNLGVVPVYPMYAKDRRDGRKLSVESPFYDMSKMNWTIFNIDSESRELERNQGFSMLYIQTEAGGAITTGTANYIQVPMDAKMAPGFVSPDFNILKTIMEHKDSIRTSLFEIADQNGVTAVKIEQSGVAKEWDFQAHANVLKKISGMARTAEMWISMVWKLYTKEDFKYFPEYKEDFAPRSDKSDVDLYQGHLDNNIGPENNKLAQKKMTLTIFSDVPIDEIKPAIDEIDAKGEDQKLSKVQDGAGDLDDAPGSIESETPTAAVAYNGAQVTSALDVLTGVTDGTIARETAKEMLIQFFKVTEKTAEKMVVNQKTAKVDPNKNKKKGGFPVNA